MGETLTFEAMGVDAAPLQDGLAALINRETADGRRTVEVREILVRAIGGQSGTGTGSVRLVRTTAMSGGNPVSSLKHDTSSPNLPSQVSIAVQPDSVTVASELRILADVPTWSTVTAVSPMTAALPGRVMPGQFLQPSDALRLTGEPAIQPIVLREGQGIAFMQKAFAIPHAGAVGFILTNQATGATYSVRNRDLRTPSRLDIPLFGVFNGVGSGIALEVRVVEWPSEGESGIPRYRLARISDVQGGTAGSAVSHDTANAPLPSSIALIQGPFRAVLAGEEEGVPVDWFINPGVNVAVAQQHKYGTIRNRALIPWGTDAGSSLLVDPKETLLYRAAPNEPGIILHPTEGLAVLAGANGVIDNSTMLSFDVAMTFVHAPPEAAAPFHPLLTPQVMIA